MVTSTDLFTWTCSPVSVPAMVTSSVTLMLPWVIHRQTGAGLLSFRWNDVSDVLLLFCQKLTGTLTLTSVIFTCSEIVTEIGTLNRDRDVSRESSKQIATNLDGWLMWNRNFRVDDWWRIVQGCEWLRWLMWCVSSVTTWEWWWEMRACLVRVYIDSGIVHKPTDSGQVSQNKFRKWCHKIMVPHSAYYVWAGTISNRMIM